MIASSLSFISETIWRSTQGTSVLSSSYSKNSYRSPVRVLFPSFICPSCLKTRYVRPFNSKVNSTEVCVSSSAKWLRNIAIFSRSDPLAVPYKAKHIPSKIVVFPAPVAPEMTKR